MSRSIVDKLRNGSPKILPSLLMCDFGNLEHEIGRLEQAGIEALHLDVMDGVFVPNFTYGMTIVAAIRRLTRLPLDVHLMIEHPQKYIGAFADAGADLISFHVESADDPRDVIAEIHRHDRAAGIAFNPSTPISTVAPYLPHCEMALVMSVQAGFGGQAFDENALQRLSEVRDIAGDDILLEIDGGIAESTIDRAVEQGAELLVVGSAIFKHEHYEPVIEALIAQASNAKIRH